MRIRIDTLEWIGALLVVVGVVVGVIVGVRALGPRIYARRLATSDRFLARELDRCLAKQVPEAGVFRAVRPEGENSLVIFVASPLITQAADETYPMFSMRSSDTFWQTLHEVSLCSLMVDFDTLRLMTLLVQPFTSFIDGQQHVQLIIMQRVTVPRTIVEKLPDADAYTLYNTGMQLGLVSVAPIDAIFPRKLANGAAERMIDIYIPKRGFTNAGRATGS